ncbi:MAG: hypothetical protein ABSC06_24300 [Rhodopila sp.]
MIIVTGSDAAYFKYARELILSIEACRPAPTPVGFFDLGLTEDQHAWLVARQVIVKRPSVGSALGDFGDTHQDKMGYLGRLFLRENFPGHAVYMWIDADVWMQNWAGVEALNEGAMQTGAAMVHQNERAYFFNPLLFAWQLKHFVLGYGAPTGIWLKSRPHINAGIFAMRSDAPHWERWLRHYQKAFDRTKLVSPHDQMGLNAAVYLDHLPTKFLSASCNWICDLAPPVWNAETGLLCVPYPPYTPISHLHLAGFGKTETFKLKTTDGSVRQTNLRFRNFTNLDALEKLDAVEA